MFQRFEGDRLWLVVRGVGGGFFPATVDEVQGENLLSVKRDTDDEVFVVSRSDIPVPPSDRPVRRCLATGTG